MKIQAVVHYASIGRTARGTQKQDCTAQVQARAVLFIEDAVQAAVQSTDTGGNT